MHESHTEKSQFLRFENCQYHKYVNYNIHSKENSIKFKKKYQYFLIHCFIAVKMI